MGALSPNANGVAPQPQQSPGGGSGVPGVTPGGFGIGAPTAPGPTQPNIWQKLLKGGAMGAAQGLQNYGNQQQQMRRPMAQPQANAPNPFFYGQGGSNG